MTRTARGWGGVVGMSAACALALALVVTPLGGATTAGRTAVPVSAAGQADAHYAAARDGSGTATCHDDDMKSLSPTAGSTDGAAVERIKKRGRLIVGVDQNSYLWGFRDPASGDIVGFDIDIVKAIAQNILGSSAKVQYLTIPTNQRFPDIENGTVDMVVRTVTISCKQAGNAAFSAPYFTSGQQVLVPQGSSITGYNDTLAGKKVCTAAGSTGETTLDAQSYGARVLTESNQLDCLVQLQLNQVDAVFTDSALAAGQAAQDPTVRLVGPLATREPYGVAMNLNDQDLVRRVNQVLADYEAGGNDSAWMRSYRKWLAKDLPGITGPPAPNYG